MYATGHSNADSAATANTVSGRGRIPAAVSDSQTRTTSAPMLSTVMPAASHPSVPVVPSRNRAAANGG